LKVNETLRSLRLNKKLMQSEVAEIIGVSLSSYQKYERDKNSVMPSIDVLMRIADFYNISLDYLLGRKPPSDPLATLGLTIHEISDDEFIRRYRNLPEDGRKLFLNIMRMLTEGTVIDVENDSDGDVIYQGETVYENADDETEESRLA